MRAYFTRVAQGVLQPRGGLAPVTNRYLATLRASDAQTSGLAAFDESMPANAGLGRYGTRERSAGEGILPASAAASVAGAAEATGAAAATGAWVAALGGEHAPLTAVNGARSAGHRDNVPGAPQRARASETPSSHRGSPLGAAAESRSAPGARAGESDGPWGPAGGASRESRLLPLEPHSGRTSQNGSGVPRPDAAGGSSEPPIVHIHIGRIDVRAIETPAPKTSPARTAMPKPSLAAHLRARDRSVGS